MGLARRYTKKDKGAGAASLAFSFVLLHFKWFLARASLQWDPTKTNQCVLFTRSVSNNALREDIAWRPSLGPIMYIPYVNFRRLLWWFHSFSLFVHLCSMNKTYFYFYFYDIICLVFHKTADYVYHSNKLYFSWADCEKKSCWTMLTIMMEWPLSRIYVLECDVQWYLLESVFLTYNEGKVYFIIRGCWVQKMRQELSRNSVTSINEIWLFYYEIRRPVMHDWSRNIHIRSAGLRHPQGLKSVTF